MFYCFIVLLFYIFWCRFTLWEYVQGNMMGGVAMAAPVFNGMGKGQNWNGKGQNWSAPPQQTWNAPQQWAAPMSGWSRIKPSSLDQPRG